MLEGKTILVVEDEPLVAMMVEDMLLELGAQVVGPASTLAQALALAESGDFDAALLDVNLNGERSDPVAALLRGRNIPYVFATGYGAHDRLEGGAETLQKPYRQEQVAAALARALPAKGPVD